MRLLKKKTSRDKVLLRRFAPFAAMATLGAAPHPATAPQETTAVHTDSLLLNQQSSRYETDTCHTAQDVATQNRLPPVSAVFTRMSAAPFSGTPVIQHITTPAQGVRVCTSSTLRRNDPTLVATYEASSRRIIMSRTDASRTTTIAHEAFHAHQHLQGGFYAVGSNQLLTPGDRTTGMLLIEATAAAYANVVLYEMKLTDPAANRGTITYDYGMRGTFENAFAQHYALNHHLAEVDRRNAALQHAGQSVVRALMTGQSRDWRSLYRPAAQRYMALPVDVLARESEDYQANRRNFYRLIGQVGPQLQLVPPEYLGAEADAAISRNHASFGVTAPPAAPFSVSPRRPAV